MQGLVFATSHLQGLLSQSFVTFLPSGPFFRSLKPSERVDIAGVF